MLLVLLPWLVIPKSVGNDYRELLHTVIDRFQYVKNVDGKDVSQAPTGSYASAAA